MNITLEPDGQVSYIGDLPFSLPMTNTTKRRVSHIVPLRWHKRIAFRVLRTVFGETGRVAAWTRTWQGPWLTTIIATGAACTTTTRAEAIAWEMEQLNPPLFDL